MVVDPMPDDGNDLRKIAADPTPLTTKMLLREVANLNEKLTIRLDAMDKAMVLFQENLTRVPTEVQKEVGHLKQLAEQKFAEIHAILNERSDRRAVEKLAADAALSAALQAQKELATAQDTANTAAIEKSQSATDKQIDSIKAMVTSGFKALDDKISVINGRLDRGEGLLGGGHSRQTELRLNAMMIIAIIAASVGIISLILK
jgi:hypothetical protein